MNIKTIVPQEFLMAETRNDYEVSAEMKKVWAVELDMLQELLRVCQKYNLRIWAEAGTLIGAVRHHGFIPWDDDIDMAMPREDYDMLMEIGPKEFSHPYFFQNIYTDPYYRNRHSQLRNSETTAYGEDYKSYRCNSGIFIDIFPLDDMPQSPRLIAKHFGKMRKAKQRLKFTQKALSWLPRPIYMFLRKHVDSLSETALYKRYEDVVREVDTNKCKSFCLACSTGLDPLISKHWYRETLWVDYEYIKMPIPVDYHEVLTMRFGDYMTPLRTNAYHGRQIFDTEHGYKDVLKRS